jgi:hypothetical protein
MSPQVYIVRQHWLVFVGFILAGVFFCIFPWALPSNLGRLILTCLGIFSITVGVIGWSYARLGLVVDRHGVWCRGFSLRKKLIPWDAILGVRKVTWADSEGEHEGVLMGLKDETDHPGGAELAHVVRSDVIRVLGECEYSTPLTLGHDEWDWRPDDFVALVSQAIADPQAREALGEYKA